MAFFNQERCIKISDTIQIQGSKKVIYFLIDRNH